MINIIQCIKAVPSSMVQTKKKSSSQYTMNPYDLYALNQLLELKKKFDCIITCVCMGRPEISEILVHCKAMGADNTVLLTDPLFTGADTYATTYVLYQAIKKLPCDFIVCGKEAIDGETGQVPLGLAERLGWFCMPNVLEINEIAEDKLVLKYQEQTQKITASAYYPLVISMKGLTLKSSKISLLRLKKCQSEKGIEWNAHDIQAEEERIGKKGSKTLVWCSEEIKYEKRDTIEVTGTTQQISEQIHKIIKSQTNEIEYE